MNAPILRVFGVVVLLFALLVVWTSRWTVFGAEELRDNAKNRRELLDAQRVDRGPIRDRDGNVLARSIKVAGGRGNQDTYTRRYPPAALFPHAVGYSYVDRGQAGLERFYDDALVGDHGEITSLLDQVLARKREGDTLHTTLDPGAQRVALQALGGRKGAVVVMEPDTGKVLVMASVPGYDQNAIRDRKTFEALNTDDANAPLLNRTTQALYPPGSTFKVVTAAAAIDSGKFTPDSTIDGNSGKEISGVPLANSGGKDFGTITLTTALTNSVNTVWADVAEQLGKGTMAEYMERFGFGVDPPIDLPADEKAPSGEYRNRRLLSTRSTFVDVGRMAIGQDKLLVTPLQMATVAATVANDGKRMKPWLMDRITDPDGRTREDSDPEQEARVMSASAAKELQQMMGNVVREGTGTAAALAGIEVGGKTGTAEIDPDRDLNQPWFIGFAPLDNPKYAIAATVERSVGGQGGTVAAPVAQQVLQELVK
ncbi:MAG: penicillin-binding protein 2 [Solirubrobacteraceae bacterium]|nr:penicillin-binding protein 2 [Solirubrobacteraceae bacterium]